MNLIKQWSFLLNNTAYLIRQVNLNKYLNEDILAFNYLQTLIYNYPFIPFSGGSLRPFCLNHIINDIVVNNRRKILEFGSGISSIVIGRLIKKNKLDAIVVSIEHDLEWSKQLKIILSNEGLEDVINVYHAPLTECQYSLDDNLWYDTNVLNSITSEKIFDMMIIDGPPAWKENHSTARYPALPYMMDKMNNENFSIYLDDIKREGEKAIIKFWEKDFPVKFTYSGSSLAFYYKGNAFYTEPYSYY